jgi:hypothetical protein
MVSGKTVKYLCQNSCISIVLLADSGHYHYSERDLEVIIDKFQEFILGGENKK